MLFDHEIILPLSDLVEFGQQIEKSLYIEKAQSH